MLTLLPHQLKSIEKIRQTRGVYDASDLGTGKTITALYSIAQHGGLAVVVVPAYLRCNWAREAGKFFPELPVIVYSSKVKKIPAGTRIVIMSYEAMQKTEKIFKGAQFWVFDESHALANHQSLRSKAAMAYARSYRPQKILLMSGTPIRSKIPNLYPSLRILDEVNNNGFNARFKTARSFCIEYTHEEIKKINGFLVTEYVGAKNVEELKQWLRPVYFKNKLSDVADIPSLSFVDITLDVSDKKAETQLQKEWDNYIKGGFAKPEDYGDGMVGEHISTAKAASALHKSDEVARFAIDLIESESYKKLVIFTDHRASAKNIAAKLRSSKISVRLIMGGTSDKDRDEAVQSFQNGDVEVIIGTIGAMSAGLTLTAAHCALFCDLSWTPAQNAQAYGRIHRISQKEKCIIYRFSTAGVDEAITRNIVEKTKTINAVFGEQA